MSWLIKSISGWGTSTSIGLPAAATPATPVPGSAPAVGPPPPNVRLLVPPRPTDGVAVAVLVEPNSFPAWLEEIFELNNPKTREIWKSWKWLKLFTHFIPEDKGFSLEIRIT